MKIGVVRSSSVVLASACLVAETDPGVDTSLMRDFQQ